jgi:hypothetical protein
MGNVPSPPLLYTGSHQPGYSPPRFQAPLLLHAVSFPPEALSQIHRRLESVFALSRHKIKLGMVFVEEPRSLGPVSLLVSYHGP